MPGLTEGRIVHFVLPNGKHRPAIIVHVWNNDRPYSCQLQVFTDAANDGLANVEWRTSVAFDEDGEKAGTWHWIEYA